MPPTIVLALAICFLFLGGLTAFRAFAADSGRIKRKTDVFRLKLVPGRDAALAPNYRSSIGIPLKRGGKTVGLQETLHAVTLNRISDGVISLDKNWRYTFLNDAALSNNPAGRAATLGRVIWDVHPALKGTIFQQKLMEAMENRLTTEVEDYYSELDRWFALKIYPAEDGLTIIRRDITEEKRAQEEIKRKERRFRALVENSTDGLILLGADGTVLDISPPGEKMLGCDRDRVIGTKWPETSDDESAGRAAAAFRDILTDAGAVRTIEYCHLPANGAARWLSCSLKNLLNERYLNAVVLTVRDITEQVLARNGVIAERNLSDSIINSLPGIFYLFTGEGTLLRWNHNLEKVTKYEPEEIRQMHPLDFFGIDQKETLARTIKNVFDMGEDTVLATLTLKTRETIPYFFTGKRIQYEGQPCLLGVGIDFTERLQTQEQIKATTDQLRELTVHLQHVREEERKEIARNIHDDLGQQLSAVKLGLGQLEEQTDEVAARRLIGSLIDMVGGGIDSIRRICTQLRPEILDVLGVFEAMKWQIEEFEKRFFIPVVVDFPVPEPRLSANVSINLFRVFQETLTNIARHSSATEVDVSFEINGNNLILTISDNGKGFKEEEIRAKRTLGLLGIKERVNAMNGQFIINSEPGKGTVVRIEVPAGQNV